MAGETMTAGINGLGFYPNLFSSYANQVMLNDLTNSTYYPQLYAMGGMSSPMMSPMSPMVNPSMTMNGSIFGGGMYPMTPMAPAFGGGMGYSQEDYFDYMDKNQDYAINYQIRQQQKMRQADMKLNSPEEAVKVAANGLREKILDNEQEQIQSALEKYKNAVSNLYGGEGTDAEITSRAAILYQQQFGTSMIEDLRNHGTGSFKQGFLQTLTLGIADKKTAEQNIAQITGQPVGRGETAKKVTGNVVGGVVLGSVTAVSANSILKALKVGFKNKPFVAGLIGAGVGLITALITANKD